MNCKICKKKIPTSCIGKGRKFNFYCPSCCSIGFGRIVKGVRIILYTYSPPKLPNPFAFDRQDGLPSNFKKQNT